MEEITHQRRYSHVKRSALLSGITESMQRPLIKWVENQFELEQAFALVHEEYLKAGYIREENSSRIFFNIHNLLPKSSTLIVKDIPQVVATLSIVLDNSGFGLPVDALYERELERLRCQNRNICELCSLAIANDFHRSRLYLPLFRTMYWHAVNNGMDDICIMVNPRHASFYKMVFLFEEFGPEKFYPRVQAPAVCLRVNLDGYRDRLREAYRGIQPEANLHSFFFDYQRVPLECKDWMIELNECRRIEDHVVDYFLAKHKQLVEPCVRE